MTNLPTFSPGEAFHKQVNATRLNFLSNAIRISQISPSWGTRMTQTPGGTTVTPIRRRYPLGVLPPFWPRFEPADSTTTKSHFVTISKGIVIDHLTKTGDEEIIHELLDLFDDNGNPKKFPINSGESIYVTFHVHDDGTVDAGANKPAIFIGADGTGGLHYDPPCGDETGGTEGFTYRKLATFMLDADGMNISELFGAGDNINHWRELAMFKKAGGTADVFKEYSMAQGKYLTRGITGGDGITVTQNADDIEIKTSGGNLKLTITAWTVTAKTISGEACVDMTKGSVLTTLYWQDGLFAGESPPWGASPPIDLIEWDVSHLSF